MFRLSLIFSHSLVKLFDLRLQTLTPMLNLILLLMASGVEGLSVLSLMIESSTLVHHRIVHLNLLIAAMRGRRRDVSMSNVCIGLRLDYQQRITSHTFS